MVSLFTGTEYKLN